MRIPMGIVTRDYLRVHGLAPTQCAPNMFRILGSVDALNENMVLNLTHHDVNWVYNLHHLKRQGYYLKTKYPEVRLEGKSGFVSHTKLTTEATFMDLFHS